MLKNTISLEGFQLELNQFSLEEIKLIFEKCEDPQKSTMILVPSKNHEAAYPFQLWFMRDKKKRKMISMFYWQTK